MIDARCTASVTINCYDQIKPARVISRRPAHRQYDIARNKYRSTNKKLLTITGCETIAHVTSTDQLTGEHKLILLTITGCEAEHGQHHLEALPGG